METKSHWPPASPGEALLSSPSGRRRYADYQASLGPSPVKRMNQSTSLLDRMRLARKEKGQVTNPENAGDGEDDDEETLRLELAAIEAKLKLKRLQNKNKRDQEQSAYASQVEVAVSPTKRSLVLSEPRSPGRIVLGIDKGARGQDVSLRRARTVNRSPTRIKHIHDLSSRPTSRISTQSLDVSKTVAPAPAGKSFSEKMSEVREGDRREAERKETTSRGRAKTFQFDHAALKSYQITAAEKTALSAMHQGQTHEARNAGMQHSDGFTKQVSRNDRARNDNETEHIVDNEKGDSNLFEGHSGLHLSTRILPHSFLKRTIPSDRFKLYKVPGLLKDVTSPAYELPDDVGDYVVFGIIASKSQPLDQKSKTDQNIKSSDSWQKKWDDGSQNRQKFIAFTITDLTWTVDLYLFDTAVPRYHRLTPGTVVAILNPSIMPPKKGREDTGAFSLSIHNGENTILEIGTSKHLGYCSAKKRDGQACGSWVNSSKTEICEWHLNAQIAKTQAGRMGVNAGANGFGVTGSRGSRNQFNGQPRGNNRGNGSGLLPAREGRGFDNYTGTHYYVASSNHNTVLSTGHLAHRGGMSAAKMLDLDVEDPFIAEGQLSRDREARLQKRMATQEKERQIAKQLATLGTGTGAGADYMRKRTSDEAASRPSNTRRGGAKNCDMGHHSSTAMDGAADTPPINTLSDLKSRIGHKRAAQDVELGPVKKKTRFLTSGGIKEVGRVSQSIDIGAGKEPSNSGYDNDDDDDLEIV